ncbi:hypothetical protein QF049_004161 [Paenibacillus sp. W4I10]|nr:hypothetical protein [Paenibacillus sp. W4I10]
MAGHYDAPHTHDPALSDANGRLQQHITCVSASRISNRFISLPVVLLVFQQPLSMPFRLEANCELA